MENHTNIMHPIIEFYQGKRKTTQFNLSLEEVWNLPKSMLNQGYFWIAWLFPVEKPSKWNNLVPAFRPQDTEFFRNSPEIQQRFIGSFEHIIRYWGIYLEEGELKVTEEVQNRHYWIRHIGHEDKKISRIIVSLYLCGQPELARKLQKIAVQLGLEKGTPNPETVEIWQNLI
ncbi:opioid growth factor receptor-related protein [Mannheimia sp. HC-2023]|uniref:opioid growth factor receptor-related protein n=1 Tax=Mannheimia indoligenes TaxID=3103145 RepID=UPI002FE557E4